MKRSPVLLWFLTVPLLMSGQHPLVRNFTGAEIHSPGSVWEMTQDSAGIFYAASNEGLLTYDGTSWRKTPAPGRQLRSVYTSENGMLYFGSANDFGRIHPKPGGAIRFESLKHRLPAGAVMRQVFGIVGAGRSVYFQTQRFIIHIDEETDSVSVIESRLLIEGLKAFNNRVIARSETGIAAIHPDNSISLYPAATPNEIPVGFAQFSDGTLVARDRSTRNLLRIKSIHPLETAPFFTGDPQLLRQFYIHPIVTGSFRAAFGAEVAVYPTLASGVVFFDQTGKERMALTMRDGLLSNMINNLYADRDGNLWISSAMGISKVMMTAGVRSFGTLDGLALPVRSVAIVGGALVAGTETGIFSKPAGQPAFSALPFPVSQVWSVQPWQGGLLAAGGNRGVFFYKDQKPVAFESPVSTMSVLPLNDTLVVAGLFRGLRLLRFRDGSGFSEIHRFAEVSADIRSLTVTPDGRLWGGTRFDGVFSVSLDSLLNPSTGEPALRWYGPAQGLTGASFNQVTAFNGMLLASSPDTVYRFDAGTNRFSPWNSAFKMVDYPQLQVADGRLWLLNNGTSWDGRQEPDSISLRAVTGAIQAVQVRGDTLIAATSDGLFLVEKASRDTVQKPLPLLIRAMSAGRRIFDPETQTGTIELASDEHDVMFYFASPFFVREEQTVFQCRLIGIDHEWQRTPGRNHMRYTALPHGRYTFEVRAAHPSGRQSAVKSISFRILPPWYLTWWALLLWTAAVLLLLRVAVRRYNRLLIRRNEELEQAVRDRVREISAKNEALEAKTAALQAATDLQTRFINMAIHDMRNPLGAIAGYTDLLRDALKNQHEPLGLVMRVDGMVRQMLSRIADLLDTHRTGNGVHPFEVRPLVEDLITSNSVLAARKNQVLDADIDAGAQVEGRPGDLRDAFDNLINNAIKFSPRNSRIWVQLFTYTNDTDASRWVRFAVHDEGPGIPFTDHELMFKPYQTLSAKPTGGEMSTGLGLSIVKDIVEKYGGRIWFNSNPALRKGTTFYIDLPVKEG